MLRRLVWLSFALALAAPAQKYDGPRPPKPDVPYLKHGDSLLSTEAVEEKKKDDTTYTVDGAASSAKTPLAEPVFLMQAGSLPPVRLQLFKFEVKNGHRELAYPGKKQPQAIRIVVTRLSVEGIWKIEVDESLEPGEYLLNPEGSTKAFCFQVF
jgi:hypothetical protein